MHVRVQCAGYWELIEETEFSDAETVLFPLRALAYIASLQCLKNEGLPSFFGPASEASEK